MALHDWRACWVRTRPGWSRRWIMLICVDWVPTGLHYVAELAFL